MPTAKDNRRSGTEDRNRRLKVTRLSSSFNSEKLPRPRAVSGLLCAVSGNVNSAFTDNERPKLTKLLMNVTIRGTVGAVHVVISPELTVGDLIVAVLRQYMKEGRRVTIPSCDPDGFNLHYSQFILESLDKKEKLIKVGSRNFFLCPKNHSTESVDVPPLIKLNATMASPPPPPPTCGKEADYKVVRTLFAPCWLKFINFLF
ncbi:uncharacterized protein LOC124928728 [Impatiens glandulifera]|uniref:uncharacterized protein LOC124928728 n=1 Tax=Impatiens glandulifera TaxID=253017 RepID=UPI001FB09820|nr:uncharacterized protein LOC124928728 [Impatiens glandulifera]